MPKLISLQSARALTALLALLVLSTPLFASDAIQRIPDNALGFVVVNNLAQTSGKVDQLLQQCHFTFPAPLAFVKMVTGLESGLDLSGELVIALMPGLEHNSSPEPMVLLPVSDYVKFAKSINADSSGEVCRVAIAGIDILVAQDGPYAMLMNVEHRQTMEALVGLEAEPIKQLEPITSWIENNDITLVLLQPGIQELGNWKASRTNNHNYGSAVLNRPPFHPANYLFRLFGPDILSWFRTNIQLSAIGFDIDAQQNIRMSKQLIPLTNAHDAKFAFEPKELNATQLEPPTEPIVFSGGGPLAAGWGKQLAAMLLGYEQQNVIESGLENITPELWKKEGQALELLFANLSSCSFTMLPGEEGDPLLGNFLGTATAPDASVYLDQLSQVVETWNEIIGLSTNDIQLEYKIRSRKIAGKNAREIEVDIATAAQDPNTPLVNWLFEALLGRDGKLRIKFVEINPTTFAFGLATDEQITKLMTGQQQVAAPAPTSRNAEATLKLMPRQAPWKILISPQGCTYWTSRVVNEFLVHIGWQATETSSMPISPPLGFSANFAEGKWECDLICPAETLKVVADFIETTHNK